MSNNQQDKLYDDVYRDHSEKLVTPGRNHCARRKSVAKRRAKSWYVAPRTSNHGPAITFWGSTGRSVHPCTLPNVRYDDEVNEANEGLGPRAGVP